MRRVVLLAILVTLTLVGRVPAADYGGLPLGLRDGHGIRIDSARRLDARQLDLRVATDALQLPVDVRVLLPTGYDAAPDRRYPVLYLFHGTSGRAADWVDFGNAVQTTAGLPMIVVLPDAGFNGDGGGWFA